MGTAVMGGGAALLPPHELHSPHPSNAISNRHGISRNICIENREPSTDNRTYLDLRSKLFPKSRQDFSFINLQRLLFVAAHQVNIELGHTHRSQLLQLLTMRFHRPHQAESVYHFVGNKAGIVAAYLRMMLVVIPGALLYIRRKRRGKV